MLFVGGKDDDNDDDDSEEDNDDYDDCDYNDSPMQNINVVKHCV